VLHSVIHLCKICHHQKCDDHTTLFSRHDVTVPCEKPCEFRESMPAKRGANFQKPQRPILPEINLKVKATWDFRKI
jgi:hypothetical protein